MNNEYKVIVKNNKIFLSNDFWGDMQIYKINSDKPYIRRCGEYFYFNEEETKIIREKVKNLK